MADLMCELGSEREVISSSGQFAKQAYATSQVWLDVRWRTRIRRVRDRNHLRVFKRPRLRVMILGTRLKPWQAAITIEDAETDFSCRWALSFFLPELKHLNHS